jgi:hypothetical protein
MTIRQPCLIILLTACSPSPRRPPAVRVGAVAGDGVINKSWLLGELHLDLHQGD